jgi:hypothetical protein
VEGRRIGVGEKIRRTRRRTTWRKFVE